jgi:hypothetical protein
VDECHHISAASFESIGPVPKLIDCALTRTVLGQALAVFQAFSLAKPRISRLLGAGQEVGYFPASPRICSRFVETVRKCRIKEAVRTSFSNFSDSPKPLLSGNAPPITGWDFPLSVDELIPLKGKIGNTNEAVQEVMTAPHSPQRKPCYTNPMSKRKRDRVPHPPGRGRAYPGEPPVRVRVYDEGI